MYNLFFHSATNAIRLVDEVPINRAMLYGDGFFTTMRASNGRLEFWDQHWQRITESLDYLYMQLTIGQEDLIAELARHIPDSGVHRLRLTFFRAGAGKYIPFENKTDLLAQWTEIEDSFSDLKSEHISVLDEPRLENTYSSRFKLIGKSQQTRIGVQLKRRGLADAILLNERGQVVECLSSNILFLMDGKWFTPPLEDGPLNGVMRRVLLEEKVVEERSIKASELRETEGLAKCNSIQGLTQLYIEEEGESLKSEDLKIQQILERVKLNSSWDFRGNRPESKT